MRMDVNWVWLLLALGDGKISHPGFPGLLQASDIQVLGVT